MEDRQPVTHTHGGSTHTHPAAHGEARAHASGEAAHGHAHTHAHTKAVCNRLARAIGHLESVKRMVEDGRDCSEVLIQLAAVRAALGNAGKLIIKDHIEHCVVDAVERHDVDSINALVSAIDKFV